MARTKTAQDPVAAGAALDADARPPRRRITRRKVVEEHARSYFGALAARDPDALAEHWSEEGVADIVPLAVLRGPREIAALFRQLFAAIPDLETTVTRLVAGERQAAVEWRMTGHFTGAPFQGVEPTARRIDFRGIDLLEVEDGKTVTTTAYYDGMTFARQIGVMPPRDSGPERAMRTAVNALTKVRRTMAEKRGAR